MCQTGQERKRSGEREREREKDLGRKTETDRQRRTDGQIYAQQVNKRTERPRDLVSQQETEIRKREGVS